MRASIALAIFVMLGAGFLLIAPSQVKADLPTNWTQAPKNFGGTLQLPTCVYNLSNVFCINVNNAATFYSPWNTGQPNSWTGSTAYPSSNFADNAPSCVTYVNFMFCMGNTLADATYFAAISSSGIGSWTSTTAYPIGPTFGTSCATDGAGFMYCVGGGISGPAYQTAVYSAPISNAGIGSWTSQPAITAGADYGVAIIGGFIYAVGGFNGAGNTVAKFATVSGGTVGAWTTMTNPFPTASIQTECNAFNGMLYCISSAAGSPAYFIPTASIGVTGATWNVAASNYASVVQTGYNTASNSCVNDGQTLTCIALGDLRVFYNSYAALLTTTTSIVTTVTATATATIGQVGGSPANATHFQLATNQMYVAYTQNPVPQPAVVSNITLKIFAVTVRSSTATLRLGVYLVNTPGQVPSSVYPLQLQSPTFAVQLANNSGTQFVHIPTTALQAVNIVICPSCYYGIGVVGDANGTAGGLSGIYVFASSFANQVQIPNLFNPFAPVGGTYQPGWACIPAPEVSPPGTDPVVANWYTYPSQPRCFELAYAMFTQYAVNIVVRAGSTTTVTTNAGTSTSTVTVSGTTTLTTTTEDAVTAGIANNALLYVLLATMGGLFFVGLWAGGLGGGIFGAIIGIVIGIASGIITGQYATLSIVATLIGAMAAIQLGRRGGRGGL